MKHTVTASVYSLECTEDEWYGISNETQAALTEKLLSDAKGKGCMYAAIMVDPDPILSISPIPTRHRVWSHTFPLTAEKMLERALDEVFARHVENGTVSVVRARAIVKEVFG